MKQIDSPNKKISGYPKQGGRFFMPDFLKTGMNPIKIVHTEAVMNHAEE